MYKLKEASASRVFSGWMDLGYFLGSNWLMVVVQLLCSDFRSPGDGIFGFLSHFRLVASSCIYHFNH